MAGSTKIPVFLLTGFLGSGKTTLLNRLLKLDAFSNSLVIVNEFGAVPIDHHLVEESAETIYELSNGCLCCNMRGELVETLAGMDLEKFDRIFIETTGIADPIPVFQTLAVSPDIAARIYPENILSVFDVMRGKALLEEHAEAFRQIAVADRILLTKKDMASVGNEVHDELREINPPAIIQDAREISKPEDLGGTSVHRPEAPSFSHSSEFRSAVMETGHLFSANDLIGMLNVIINRLGPDLLRIKGISHVAESDVPWIVQVSGQIIHEPAPANQSKNLSEGTQLVVITKSADPEIAVSIFNGFAGNPATDTADKDALMNNPLSVPGT